MSSFASPVRYIVARDPNSESESLRRRQRDAFLPMMYHFVDYLCMEKLGLFLVTISNFGVPVVLAETVQFLQCVCLLKIHC